MNRLSHLLAQFEYLPPRGVTEIDQDQGLPVVDGCPAHLFAFPAAMLDQPAGGQLEPIVALGIVGYVRIDGLQPRQDAAVNDGVLEEAARITDHFGIGHVGF